MTRGAASREPRATSLKASNRVLLCLARGSSLEARSSLVTGHASRIREDCEHRRESLSSGVDLSVDFAGLRLRNPLVAASGTCGWGEELERVEGFSNRQLGAIILKSVTREPRLGNPTPRIVETAGGAGLINSIGLENPGVEA
ncbi:MAG: hypothetical protein FJ291_25080, partial [Planctomycetes bacterium]|nr:hypothetical protein [Planctomycetota bacterium]